MSQGGHSDPTTSSDSDAIEIPSSNNNNGTLTNLEGGIAECCVKTDDENAMKLSNEAKSRSNSPPKELHALSPCLNLSLTTASLPSTSEDWSSTCKTTSENGEDNNIKSDSSNHSDGDNNVNNNNNTDGNSNNIIPRKCVYSSAGKRKAALPRKRPALPEEPVQISAETGEVVEDECCDVMNCCSSDLMAATSSEIIPVAFDQTSCSKRLGITTSTGRKNRSSNYSQSYPKESSPSSSITPTDKAGINISSNFPLPSQSSTIDHYQTVDKSGDLDGSNSSLIMNNALTNVMLMSHCCARKQSCSPSTNGLINDKSVDNYDKKQMNINNISTKVFAEDKNNNKQRIRSNQLARKVQFGVDSDSDILSSLSLKDCDNKHSDNHSAKISSATTLMKADYSIINTDNDTAQLKHKLNETLLSNDNNKDIEDQSKVLDCRIDKSLIRNNALNNINNNNNNIRRHASSKGIVNDNNSSNKYAMISTHDSSAATTAALLNGLCANNLPANIQDLLTTPSPATLNSALNQLILASASGVVDMSAFGTLNMSDLLSASAGSQGILPFLGANLADLNMDPQKMQLTLIEAATMAAANSAFCGLVGSTNNLSSSELDQLNVCDAILKQQQSHHHKQTSSVSKCSSKQPHLSTSLSLLNNTSDNNKKYSNSISNANNMIQLPSVIMSGTDPMNTLANINQKVNNNPSSLQIDSSNSDHRVSIGIPLPAVLPEVNGSSQNVNAESRESFLLRDSRLTISQKLLAAEEEAAAGNDTPKMTREDRIDLEELENFAQTFKKQRIKFGFTQGDVGMALGRRYGTDFSQTTISRFEALNLSFKNMCKLRPLLKEWLADAENAIANGATASDLLEAQKNPDLSGNQMNPLSATNATVLTSSGSLLTSSSGLVDSGSLSPNGTATTTTKSYSGGLGTCHLNSATSGLLAANSNALSSNNTAILTTATSIPLRKRRKRTNLDSAQRAALDGYFQINSRPDHERMAQIAQTLELDRDVVRVWFCNRRQKVRKE